MQRSTQVGEAQTQVLTTAAAHSVASESWDPKDCSSPGSSVNGNLQARILEWVPFSSPGDLPDLVIEPGSPALWEDSSPSEPPGKPISH